MSRPDVVNILLIAAAVPAVAASLYLAVLALMAWPRRLPVPGRTITFDLIVPAHDEAAGIGATVSNLQALDYPQDRRRILVVADNCTDDTADIARRAGATVIERHDLERRGKGYALACGFQASASDHFADAVVVVDADSLASSNLLGALAARIADGAEAVQVEYGVRNPASSWRTRLLVVALALFHTLRSLARERLGLSCGLRGNGMCFTRALLDRVPYSAFSLVEDVEYGIALGMAGVRVRYTHEARVLGEMPTTGAASRSQRQRWEGGRWRLVLEHVPRLLRASFARRDPVPLDLAIDLMIPPLATLAIICLAGSALAAGAAAHGEAYLSSVVWWAVSVLGLAIYLARGCALSGVGPRVIVDLLWAPIYVFWKLSIICRPGTRQRREWVRTARRWES